MRLWHYKLIPYLPNSQLVAQWRELNSIYKKQDKHILINYIYNYDKEYLLHYSILIKNEMLNRGFQIKSWKNYDAYFADTVNRETSLRYPEHDVFYLEECFYNLREKHRRGQKDFSEKTMTRLQDFFYNERSQKPFR